MKQALYFLFAIIMAAACGGDDDATLRELNDNKRKWVAADKVDYQYTYQQTCFCPQNITAEVSIMVIGNTISSITRTSDDQVLDSTLFDSSKTIDELFLVVEDAIDGNAHKLTVSYDSEWGYPTLIDIDYAKNLIDEEITIMASKLTSNEVQ